MHEFSIAQSLLEAVLETAQQHGGGKVLVVRLRIGELRQVIGATLKDAFEMCAAGTLAERAALEIEWVPTVWRCRECGRDRPLNACDVTCVCGETAARMEGSDDLLVTSIDLDDEA